jgi:hypothetical protein
LVGLLCELCDPVDGEKHEQDVGLPALSLGAGNALDFDVITGGFRRPKRPAPTDTRHQPGDGETKQSDP